MRFLIIIFLLAFYLIATKGRPSQNEENKQTGEADYDAGEIAGDYVQENREHIDSEPQQRSYDDHEASQNDEEGDELYSEQNSDEPEVKKNVQFSDAVKTKPRSSLNNNRHQKDVSEELLAIKKDTNKRASYKEKTDTLEGDGNLNIPSEANEEDVNILYKDYPEKDKKEINNYRDNDNEGTKQRSIFNLNKESYAEKQAHDTEISENKFKNLFLSDRSRRGLDVTTTKIVKPNGSNEKEVIADCKEEICKDKDSKELSKQEIEDLLNSLSIDKINIVKQLINSNENISKKDRTKKATAVKEEDSTSGISDAKQMIVEANTSEQGEMCMPCPCPCSPPCQVPCPCPSTCPPCPCPFPKTFDFNSTTPSDTESNAYQERSVKEIAKNVESGISETKSDNDREPYSENISNLEGTADDYSELQKFDRNILKRELSKVETPNSIQSLEESFPNLNSNLNTNSNSDLEPLVRVKRTGTQDDFEEDSSLQLPSQSENNSDQQDETNDYEYIESDKQLTENNKNEINGNRVVKSLHNKRQRSENQNNQVRKIRNMNFETDNIGIGSDTDNVLTNSEKIGETITYDGKSRNKRMEGTVSSVSLDTGDRKLGYNRQIADKIDNLETSNNENGLSDAESDSFGSVSGHMDLNRFKRIRQVTKEVQNKEPNV